MKKYKKCNKHNGIRNVLGIFYLNNRAKPKSENKNIKINYRKRIIHITFTQL